MVETVKSLLDNFSHENRDAGKQLTSLFNEDPKVFQRAVVQYLSNSSNGGGLPSVRLVVWLLQREGKLVEIFLNPEMSSVEESVAVVKLVKQVSDQVDVRLATRLKGADEELAHRILRLLAVICDSNRTLPLLIRALREQSSALRSKAAFIFARYSQNNTFLEHILQDPDPDVRAKAVEGLSVADYSPAASVLVHAMNDPDPSVRARVFVALYRLGERERALILLGKMAQHPEFVFRAGAAWALGQIGDHRCFRMLETLCNDPEEAVLQQARETLERIRQQAKLQETAEAEAPQKLTVHPLCATVNAAGKRSIYVAVCDGNGEPLSDLDEHDFRIEEGGQAVSCTIEGPSTRKPPSLAWVLDCSGSMSAGKIQDMTATVAKSMQMKGPQDRMAIYKYSFDIQRGVEFTTDLQRLGVVMRLPFTGAKTASRLHDAIWQALEAILPEPGYRAVVAIADGVDRGSEHTFPAVVRRFRSSGVPLCVIGFGSGTAQRNLGGLAEQSGGKFLPAQSLWELSAACKSLVVQSTNHYSLTYELEGQPVGPVRLVVKVPGGGSCETSTELLALPD